MKQIKMLLLTSMVILFTACGGGSSGGTTVTIDDPQLAAMSIIKAYANDSTNRTPTVLTYKAAGVTGVTDENIDEVNEVVASLTPSDVDTPEEIQKIVDDLGINILPTANAGPDKTIEVSQIVTITGSGTDIDGTIVSYEWTKGTAVLATTASFDYIPTVVGTDVLTLTVMDDDGGTASNSMNVVVLDAPPINQSPVANAGISQDVPLSSTVTLDGSGSSDPENNPLSYSWIFVDKPVGSNATLLNSTTVSPIFIADESGIYEIQLTVSDGQATSNDTVIVTAALADGIYFYKKGYSSYTPVALPSICDGVTCVKRVTGTYVGVTTVTHGEYKLIAVGQDYTIDSLTAIDAYNVTWAQFSGLSQGQIIRAGSDVEFSLISGLTNNQEAKLQWLFSINGTASFMETIYFTSNGTVTPPPNTAPVADAGSAQDIHSGSTVTLDGSGSSDADGDDLTYIWSFVDKPEGSNAFFSDTTLINPTFIADIDGDYTIELTVNDRRIESTAAIVTVTAISNSGTLDPTFGEEGIVKHYNGQGNDMVIDSAGNIYVTGYISDQEMIIWKYKSDGTLDTTFSGDGMIVHHYPNYESYGNAIALDSAGNIYVTGSLTWKYKSDGTPDETFSENGIVPTGGNDIAVDSAGNVYVTGSIYNDDNRRDMIIWKYKSDGTLDPTFDGDGIVTHDGTADGYVWGSGYDIVLDSDGNIYVTGSREIEVNNPGYEDSGIDMVIWKYKSDGTLDGSFSDDGIVVSNAASGYYYTDNGNAIALDSAGNIYVTGRCDDGDNWNVVTWKYKSDGTLDNTFGDDGIVKYDRSSVEALVHDMGYDIALDDAGNIYVAGFTNTGGKMLILKYKSDGTLDNTFNEDGAIIYDDSSSGLAIALDSTGNVYVTGYYVTGYVSGSHDMIVWKYK